MAYGRDLQNGLADLQLAIFAGSAVVPLTATIKHLAAAAQHQRIYIGASADGSDFGIEATSDTAGRNRAQHTRVASATTRAARAELLEPN